MYALVVLATLLYSAAADELPEYGIIGHLAYRKDVPFQVSLEYRDDHRCSGAIISPKVILTTASCINKLEPELLTVRVGTAFAGYGGQVFKVAEYIIHPQFDPESFDYDIATVTLVEPLQLNAHVRPVEILKKNQLLNTGSMYGTVSGWNAFDKGSSPLSLELRSATVFVVDRNFCMKILNGLTDRMFCAVIGQIAPIEQDPCRFDSGSLFVVDGKLLGMMSWGPKCDKRQLPRVYTNIPELTNWIDKVIG